MNNNNNKVKLISKVIVLILLVLFILYLYRCSRPDQEVIATLPSDQAQEAGRDCLANAYVADVVAIDHPMVFNRLGAQNVNWMMYALRHDIVDLSHPDHPRPLNYSEDGEARFLQARKHPASRDIALRPDLRPRPLVLRVPEGSCLKVRFTNLVHQKPLASSNEEEPFPNQANPFKEADWPPNQANPFKSDKDNLKNIDHPVEHVANDIDPPPEQNQEPETKKKPAVEHVANDIDPPPKKNQEPETKKKPVFNIDDQVASRWVGFHVEGLDVVHDPKPTGAYVGDQNGLLAPANGDDDDTIEYLLYAAKEGSYLVTNEGAPFGGEGTAGNSGVGLFGAVIVEPKGARFYRGQVTEEEMRLARVGETELKQPIINYETKFDCSKSEIQTSGWCKGEEKNGLPVLNMVMRKGNEFHIIHGDINAIVVGAGSDAGHPNDGHFPKSTYPLESQNRRNPAYPNRLEPFREFVSIFHDENAATQAFPYFFEHPVLRHTLHGVRDAFMINYGSGGVGAEIIANRLQAGPMQDCIDCAYEEFFLSSFAVGDPAMLVDKPANLFTGRCQPEFLQKNESGEITNSSCIQPKGIEKDTDGNIHYDKEKDRRATLAFYPHDPANVHHSYMGDFVKFRNMHSGKEQHIFHLHNHQWLFNPNDDNSNYIDAQGIGPGSGYTYEIAYGGSGNRNKTAGDAIFHCHFYPHFAQGMWYLWRIHDVFESGTPLAVSQNSSRFHEKSYELQSGKPAENVRALPDGEIVNGTPIPAVVPLPGKAMALIPASVSVKPRLVADVTVKPPLVADDVPYGSRAEVRHSENQPNPGYPFWVAGAANFNDEAEKSSVGSRPTTPPLDMSALTDPKNPDRILMDPRNSDQVWVTGHDGGLPRHSMAGYSTKGKDDWELSRFSAEKHVKVAKPVYYDEKGTALEKIAMRFHATRKHPSFKIGMDKHASTAEFETNGAQPVAGAPFNDPCIDDLGNQLISGNKGQFFAGGKAENVPDNMYSGLIEYGADRPRVYKGADIQLDVVFNKVGYHYPQQRILALWEDVLELMYKNKAPEPLVLRMNSFDCAMYAHTNLVPKVFYLDDYQITTPTDVIGQHIHLPKWDLTSADGSANGWNYEDGTFSPGEVRARISAINKWNDEHQAEAVSPPSGFSHPLKPVKHPYFGHINKLQLSNCEELWQQANGDAEEFDKEYGYNHQCEWFGARTTLQRWFSDPLVNSNNKHRGLGTTFTHDHLGPSTHQQLGLYATMLTEPPGSEWYHNESGDRLYDEQKRSDGGPTSWQAIITNKTIAHKVEKEGAWGGYFSFKYILDKAGELFYRMIGTYDEHNQAPDYLLDIDEDNMDDSHREFFLQFGDFQHAYQKGKYFGVNENGKEKPPTQESFKYAINPSVRKPANPQFPDIFAYEPYCRFDFNPKNPRLPNMAFDPGTFPNATDANRDGTNDAVLRPCPEAISADDVGMLVVNYRNEPVGLRVYDENTKQQAKGLAGDMAFALSSLEHREIDALNSIDGNGNVPYPPLTGGLLGSDPFTPLLRANSGDLVKIKIQAGSHEHEHNSSINGTRWIQSGSGFGMAPNSGWRNAQNIGLSEQFTMTVPIVDYYHPTYLNDRLYQIDTSQDGLWSGVWGIMRSSTAVQGDNKSRCKMYSDSADPNDKDLCPLPNNIKPTLLQLENGSYFQNICPKDAKVRHYEVTAALANDVLDNALGVKIPDQNGLNANGGSLIYNPRMTTVSIKIDDVDSEPKVVGSGPLHDPTAILFVRTKDIDARTGKLKPESPLEPVVLRAAAGECIELVLHNRLPFDANKMPDLNGFTSLSGIVPHNLKTSKGSQPDSDNPESSLTTFNNNAIKPSNWIGLHPQMVHYNVQDGDGDNVGINRIGTTPPGWSKVYHWYAGALNSDRDTKLNKSCPRTEQEDEVIAKSLKVAKAYDNIKSISEFVTPSDLIAGITGTLRTNHFSESQIESFLAKIQPVLTQSACFTARTIPNSIDKIAISTQPMPDFSARSEDEAPVGSSNSLFDLLNNEQPVLKDHLDCLRNENLIGRIDEALATDNTAAMGNTRDYLKCRYRELLTNGEKMPKECDLASQQKRESIYSIDIVKKSLGLKLDNSDWTNHTVALEEGGLMSSVSRSVRGAFNFKDIDCRFEPIEFGGTNLTPPDRIKQGQKGAVGALIVEPKDSIWKEFRDDEVDDRQQPGNKRKTRATATVEYQVEGEDEPRVFRDIAFMHQKGLNLRYQDGRAVANIAAENEKAEEVSIIDPITQAVTNVDGTQNLTAPEDAHDSGHMAINYSSEPLWFRFGLAPDAPFGKEGFGGVHKAWQSFAKACCKNGGTAHTADDQVGDPVTPVYSAVAGQEMRVRTLMPTGVGRATVVELHGHHWMRDPYLAQEVDADPTRQSAFPHGILPHLISDLLHDGGQDDWRMPSKCIGQNALAMTLGGQESITPMTHFDMVFPRAGGINGVAGDYLWRDRGGFGITNGLWGIVRVEKPEGSIDIAPNYLRLNCE